MTYYLLVSVSARLSIIKTFSFSYSKAYFKDPLTTIKSTMDITIMRVEASFFDQILEELITIIAEHLENETQYNWARSVIHQKQYGEETKILTTRKFQNTKKPTKIIIIILKLLTCTFWQTSFFLHQFNPIPNAILDAAPTGNLLWSV